MLKLKLRDQRRALGITKAPSSPKKSKKKGGKKGQGSGSGKSKHGKKGKDSERSKKRKRLSQGQGQQKYWRVLEQMMHDDPSWAFSDLLATLKSAFSSSLGGGLPRNFPSDDQVRSHYNNYRKPKTARVRSPSPKKAKRSPASNEPVNIYMKELRRLISEAPTEELCLHPVREKLVAHFNFSTTQELPNDFPTNAMISRRINYAKKKREKLHPGEFPVSTPQSQNSVYSMFIRELVEHQPRIKFAAVKAKLLQKFTLPDGSLPKDFPTTSGLSSRTAFTRRQFKTEKKLEFFEFVQEYKSRNQNVDVEGIAKLLQQPFKGYQTKDFLQEPDINEVLALFRNKLPAKAPTESMANPEQPGEPSVPKEAEEVVVDKEAERPENDTTHPVAVDRNEEDASTKPVDEEQPEGKSESQNGVPKLNGSAVQAEVEKEENENENKEGSEQEGKIGKLGLILLVNCQDESRSCSERGRKRSGSEEARDNGHVQYAEYFRVSRNEPQALRLSFTMIHGISSLRCSFVGDTWCYPSSILNVRDY